MPPSSHHPPPPSLAPCSFTLTVSNVGSGPATDVQLRDPIPDGLRVAGFQAPGRDACRIDEAATPNVLECSISELPPGPEAAWDIQLDVVPEREGM